MPIQERPGTAKQGSSTQFAPTSIAGCTLWLDGKDPAGTGTPPSTGATVSTWTDKAAGKNGAATGSPTYVAGGGINFNGAAYFLNQTFTQNLSQRSIFIVMQETVRNHAHGVLSLIPNPTSGTDYITATGLSIETSNGLRFYGNGGLYFSDIGNTSLLPKAIYNDNMNGTTGSGFVNGTNATNATAAYTAGTCSGYGVAARWIGGMSTSYAFNGVVYEILFFNTPLSVTDRRTIEGYLAQKWGLTASLPAGHPGPPSATVTVAIPYPITSIAARPQPKFIIGEKVYVAPIIVGSINFVQTGSAQYATVPANAGFNFGTGNFTIEGWFYCANINNGNQDMMVMQNGSAYIIIGITANGGMRVHYNDTPTSGSPFNRILMPTGTAVANTWTHFCVMRSGNTYSFFLNGKCVGSISGIAAAQMGSSALPWYLGADAGGNRFTGNLSCIRIVNGSLVYSYGTVVGTTYFTRPTAPPTKIGGTQLLLLFSDSSTFLQDTSSNGSTLTNTGASTYSALNPF